MVSNDPILYEEQVLTEMLSLFVMTKGLCGAPLTCGARFHRSVATVYRERSKKTLWGEYTTHFAVFICSSLTSFGSGETWQLHEAAFMGTTYASCE